ncbi:MAG: hypothetical protein KAJ29_06015 [Alphaproteobacteria bacterium]|nr:hypothetical protein [Alphaproteobacteria bacterium]
MSLSLAPSRTVLVISDDALFVYSISVRGVKLVDTVPWSVENFEDEVALIISKECSSRPVLIVNDMVEQHYRKEKVPRVSILDKRNVVNRKLHVAFPNYAVRAALPLKEKIAKTDKSMVGDVFLFAAVPATDAFKKTLAAAAKSLVPIVGVVLLPVESSDMVKKLAEKIGGIDEKEARWTIFVGQHQGGGLRQIVIKDGSLALTRMTPIVESEEDPEAWANEVHQEFQATMSYLSRFGFDADDGLNVIMVSEPEIGEKVGSLLDVQCNFHSVSTDDIAQLMHLKLGVQNNYYCADALHIAWIGKKNRFILPMKAKQIDSVSKPRKAAVAAIVLLILGGAFQSYQFIDMYQKLLENQDSLDNVEYRGAQLGLQYEKEVKRKKDLGFDIKLMQSAFAVYDGLAKKHIPAIQLFEKIGEALGKDMRIDRIQVTRGRDIKKAGFFPSKNETLFWSAMQMTFPSNTDAQKGNEEVNRLRGRLQSLLPDHVVKVGKLLEDYEYSEEIVVETGSLTSKSVAQDYVAEIRIEGPIIDD